MTFALILKYVCVSVCSMWAVTGFWVRMFGKIAAVFVEEMEAAARSSRGSSMTPCLKEVQSVCTSVWTGTVCNNMCKSNIAEIPFFSLRTWLLKTFHRQFHFRQTVLWNNVLGVKIQALNGIDSVKTACLWTEVKYLLLWIYSWC